MSGLAANEIINSKVCSLAAAAGAVGSLQIRNVATVAGNIVSAQPAADTAVILAGLDAQLTVHGKEGTRNIALQDSYTRIGQSVIDANNEVVVKITFKAPLHNQGTAYVRLAQRKALALPTLNVGVMLSVSEDKIEWARIVMAPVGIKPARATEAEYFLAGKKPSAAVFKEAGVLAVKNAEPRTSLIRGSKEYRLAVLPSLVTKALIESANEIEVKGGMQS
jgi:carbon-monoxide dehydrogenase medium subunit